ncbi:MAG: molybdate ABC transporter substrate-binding protein [Gammaproteobacteria bacterium]|nr:molybdate ABC transporter substrate-binding protein [Gammaproteobacteria bacterium]
MMSAFPSGQFFVFMVWLIFQSDAVLADTIRIAVSSNFYPTLTRLIQVLSIESRHEFDVISGSTGVLYAQIENGAPFDIFMAADKSRPALLDAHGLIEPGSRKTYAIGQLALWAPDSNSQVDKDFLLEFEGNLAIANPDIAPYGVAAKTLLHHMDISQVQFVMGNNVGQTFQFVQTGNAKAGLVALSQVLHGKIESRFFWAVEHSFYEPIEQQMVIMNRSPGSIEFANFLTSETAIRILLIDGYELPGNLEK